MFGFAKKKIPASARERTAHVRRLFLMRCREDPMVEMMVEAFGDDPHKVSDRELMQGAPELTIVATVEQCLLYRDQGASEVFAIRTLSEMHAAAFAAGGQHLPVFQGPQTLEDYVAFLIHVLHGHGAPMSRHFIGLAIAEVVKFYERLG